jgi:hypothetical protein
MIMVLLEPLTLGKNPDPSNVFPSFSRKKIMTD